MIQSHRRERQLTSDVQQSPDLNSSQEITGEACRTIDTQQLLQIDLRWTDSRYIPVTLQTYA